MKTLLTFLASTLFILSGFAQYGNRDSRDNRNYDQRQYGQQYSQTVSISFNGNGNGNSGYQVVLDGTTYSSRKNNNGTWNRNTSNQYGDDDITINNVQAGQHTIQVYRIKSHNRNYGSATASPVYSSTFNVRQGFDVMLDIKNNGRIQLTEKRSNSNINNGRRDRRSDDRRDGVNNNGGYNNGNGGYNNNGNPNNNSSYRTPMADYQFSQILQDVKSKWFQPAKVTAVRDAFNHTSTYFSTYQITQLLQLISDESNRLELAKLSYRVVADPANFTQIYNLFSSQNSRDEIDRYVRGNRY